MTDDSLLPFSFPAIRRKKVTAAFDGGRISSDGGDDLCSQSTISRWENAPSLREIIRLLA